MIKGVRVMKIYVEKNYDAVSRRAANLISAQVILKPESVLGLATGSSPIGTYKQLVEWYNKNDLDFSKVRTVNLDEYVGLPKEDDHSYHYFMNDNLFSKVDIKPENVHLPNGMAKDIELECKDYDDLIALFGGADLQVLGLGRNGHIGFNEPDDHFSTGTHLVNLTQSTIEANSRLFDDESMVPRQAITMGIKSIMSAKKIVLIVSGADKADALNKCLNGAITPEVPGSILQLHNDLYIVADEAAMGR